MSRLGCRDAPGCPTKHGIYCAMNEQEIALVPASSRYMKCLLVQTAARSGSPVLALTAACTQ